MIKPRLIGLNVIVALQAIAFTAVAFEHFTGEARNSYFLNFLLAAFAALIIGLYLRYEWARLVTLFFCVLNMILLTLGLMIALPYFLLLADQRMSATAAVIAAAGNLAILALNFWTFRYLRDPVVHAAFGAHRR